MYANNDVAWCLNPASCVCFRTLTLKHAQNAEGETMPYNCIVQSQYNRIFAGSLAAPSKVKRRVALTLFDAESHQFLYEKLSASGRSVRHAHSNQTSRARARACVCVSVST